MYVDDLVLACRAYAKDGEVLKNCFDTYCNWSGKWVNVEKSSILFSKNIGREEIRKIKNIKGLKEMGPG